MPNTIKTSDLYKNTSELSELIAELQEVQAQYSTLIESIKKDSIKMETALKKTPTSSKKQRDEIEETAKQADILKKKQEKYQASLSDVGKELAALQVKQRQQNALNRFEAKLTDAKAGSYDALSAQYSINKIRLNAMTEAERKASDAGQVLEQTTAEIFEKMKALQEATGKHVLSVGDYEKGTRSLLAQLEEMPGALGDTTKGIKQVGNQFKALLRNPIVLFIAAIVGALTLLFGAFSRSEKGAALMAKATGLLNGIMSQLTKFSVSVAEGLEAAFKNPQQAVKDLGNLLVNQILNRVKAIPLIAESALNALKALWNRDMDALKEAGEDAFFAVNQAITGLDEESQKEFALAVSEATEEVINQTNAFIDLETAKRNIRKSNRELAKSIEKLTTIEQQNLSIADDTTKSFAEREAAAERARAATEKRSAVEIKLAKNNLALINTEVDLRRKAGENVEDLLDAQLNSYRELATAEREYTLAVRDNERTRDELKQDRLERDLDILIDGFDNQKTVNERLLQNERLTQEERVKILNDTVKLSDDSFAKQIETIQQFTGIAIDSNSLISESDAVLLNQKIRSLGLSEIIEGRLLEIIRDRKSANQDLADAQIALNKKLRDESLNSLKTTQEVAKIEFESVKRNSEEKTSFEIAQKQKQLEAIKELNAKFSDTIPPIDTKKLEAELKKLQKVLKRSRSEVAQETFDIQQQFAKSEFDLLTRTEKKKTLFSLDAERDRLKKILELHEKFGSDLSDVQIATIKNQIKAVENEIGKVSRNYENIYDVFGLNVSAEQQEGIRTATQFAISQITELANKRVEIANQAVEARKTEVDQAYQLLQAELAAEADGDASRSEAARQQLEEAKARQKEALNEQRKAQRQQQVIESIQQATSMVTASAKIFSQFGNPLVSIPLIALMWGSFIGAKVRAAQLAKQQFGEGDLEFYDYGNTHASGKDIYIGQGSKSKKSEYVERGESRMILPARTTRKYRSILKPLFESLKAGTYEHRTQAGSVTDTEVMPTISVESGSSTDMSKTNDELVKIRKQGESKRYTDEEGNPVIQRGTHKMIIRNR